MLFDLHVSLADELETIQVPDSRLIDGVENIAHARRQGKHHVFARPPVLERLSRCTRLSREARGVFTVLYSRFPTMGSLAQKMNRRVEVFGNDGVSEIVQTTTGKALQLSATYFADSSRVAEVSLLCEDQNDVAFFLMLAEIYLTWAELGSIELDCTRRAGGGENTHKELEVICKEKRSFCICIVDSDRKCPSCELGNVAKKVRKVDGRYPTNTKELLLLEVRDVENLIPVEIIEAAIGNDPQRKPGVLALERLLESSMAEAAAFWDIKAGLRLGDIVHAKQNSPYLEFWRNVPKVFNEHLVGTRDDCWAMQSCNSPSKCQCQIACGLGDKILQDVNNYLANTDHQQVAELVHGKMREDWTKLGLTLVSWLCTAKPLRS